MRQFLKVEQEWKIADKVTTVGAARPLPYKDKPCVIQRGITAALCDSGFVNHR